MGGCDMSCTHTYSGAYLFILEEHRTYGGYLLIDSVDKFPCFDRRVYGTFQLHVYLER